MSSVEVLVANTFLTPLGFFYQWTVQGDILQDYIRTNALGKRIPVTNDATWGLDHHVGYLQPAIQFFWEDSTVGEVDTKTVSVRVSNINGQSFTIDSMYAVSTPTVGTLREQGTEGFNIPLAPTEIGLYNAAGAPNGNGMLFTATVTMPAGFTREGHWNFLQRIQPDRSFTTEVLGQAPVTVHLTNNALWGLDTSEAYPDFVEPHYDSTGSWPTASPDTAHSTVDSPGAGLATPSLTKASISDHYSMFVMFLPPGGSVRWVPLQVDNWRFNVAATKNVLNTWNLDDGHGRGPGSWTVPVKSPEWTILHSASEPMV